MLVRWQIVSKSPSVSHVKSLEVLKHVFEDQGQVSVSRTTQEERSIFPNESHLD